ncbi:Uncharacterised protein [Mycobacteroides abscessus subsp. abscessus]|nr:Uncharacterised protein [Mycobacteroides abscessus subsp. abscessus]
MGEPSIQSLHHVLAGVDREHLGVVVDQFKCQGLAEAAQSDDGHGIRRGDVGGIGAAEEAWSSQ